MKLLVGLGNPGKQHASTRHNLGFIFSEAWMLAHGGEGFSKKEFQGETARVKVEGEEVLVLRPHTYYNRSGEAVQEAMQFYKIAIEDVTVLHDELDLPPHVFRVKRGGSAGGNNGLKSIVAFGEDFVRVRLGIGRPPHADMDTADYVLSQLTKEDWAAWEENTDDLFAAIDLCVLGKAAQAMNKFNASSKKEKKDEE